MLAGWRDSARSPRCRRGTVSVTSTFVFPCRAVASGPVNGPATALEPAAPERTRAAGRRGEETVPGTPHAVAPDQERESDEDETLHDLLLPALMRG